MDVEQLKQPATKRVFRAWFEDWEVENVKKNDAVAEALFIEKHKNLVFWDPDTEKTFVVAPENLEWRRGKNGGWHLICEEVGGNELEPFDIEVANELIGETQQADGIEILHPEGSAQEGECGYNDLKNLICVQLKMKNVCVLCRLV